MKSHLPARAAALGLAIAAGLAAPAAATPREAAEAAPDSAWRPVDPENLVIFTLSTGEVAIELRPDFAPGHVERIRTLTRRGFYDGISFHRVIEGFMAQGGDPKGDGTGGSDLPDLKAEFTHTATPGETFRVIGRDTVAARVGYVNGAPVGGYPEESRAIPADGELPRWPLHCEGAASMARATPPDSANSQFFLIFSDARTALDREYSIWGYVVDGQNAVDALPRGEPPERPGKILRARVAADMRDAPKIEVMRTETDAFGAYLAEYEVYSRPPSEGRVGFVRDICQIPVPKRVNGEVKL